MRGATLVIALSASLAGSAAAQLTPIPAFAGANTEEFDNSLPGGRILQNTATIAPSPGGQFLLPQAWLVYVGYTVTAMGGSNSFLGTSVGHAILTFDDPVQRFGAYFAAVGYVSGGYALVYAAAGNLLGNEPLAAPRGGPWVWDGWDAGAGAKIKRIELFANDPYNNGALLCVENAECDIWLGQATTRPTGCSTINIAVNGLPVIGDTLTFTTPGTPQFAAFGVGTPISVLLPQCPGCVVGVDPIALVGRPYVLDIPHQTSLLDALVSVQAFGIGGTCLGFLELSDTIDVRVGL